MIEERVLRNLKDFGLVPTDANHDRAIAHLQGAVLDFTGAQREATLVSIADLEREADRKSRRVK